MRISDWSSDVCSSDLGGTPNFLDGGQLQEMMETLRSQFRFSRSPGRDISIELDPRFVSPADIAGMAELGFNRASFGVQDFDPAVQEAVNRIQSVEETRAVVDACRAGGFRSVNIDLIRSEEHTSELQSLMRTS